MFIGKYPHIDKGSNTYGDPQPIAIARPCRYLIKRNYQYIFGDTAELLMKPRTDFVNIDTKVTLLEFEVAISKV